MSLNLILEHRWSKTLKVSSCHVCNKKILLGLKCKNCKFKCHKDCVENVTQECVLTSLSSFKKRLPITPIKDTEFNSNFVTNSPSQSNSSAQNSFSIDTNSNNTSYGSNASGFSSSLLNLTNRIVQSVRRKKPTSVLNLTDPNYLDSSLSFNKSEPASPLTKNSNENQLISSIATQTTLKPHESNDGDETEIDEPIETKKQKIDLQQFNIHYNEIIDKIKIGQGQFGTVYKAYWHGTVACKEFIFNENINEDSDELIEFEQEILNLKKTRHSNLILFIGAYIKPPKCAIVMSLCRGLTLYKYLHVESHFKIDPDWIIEICTQIAQAMGYLHNKQMVHKDLRSKNIFINGNKAVIADFGLYSIRSLCNRLTRDDLVPITKECLYYMAPEVVRLIGSKTRSGFSRASDVYAFGTIWHEMFCREFPFSLYSTHTILYQVGNGLVNSKIQLAKEYKMILLKCWSKDPLSRPEFSSLLETLRGIPKKTKLIRSPSHPIHINMR